MREKPVLVAGATGYVGGRLIPRLLDAGWRVRALGRSPGKLSCRPWARHPNCELAAGDVLDLPSLSRAARGCGAAFYLVHSMHAGHGDFAEADRRGALHMAAAAAAEGLSRIIYLGGLGEEGPGLSTHLKSRAEVARILRAGPVPATVLRAAMILGSGSASFEMLRYLVDRLPVMVTPRWVKTPCQPIAIRNVLGYLEGCLEHAETTGETYDIGGPEVTSYRELIDIYAGEAGLSKRLVIPVPVLTPRLSSCWIHLVTPVPAALARPLAEGLKNKVVCREDRITCIIPQRLLTCRETMRLALEKIRQQEVETCWTDAGELHPPEWVSCGDAPYAGGTVLSCAYRIRVRGTPEDIWRPLARIGGEAGWYFGRGLWGLRGGLDRLLGGVGLRRGRRDPENLRQGDALDFWRVLDVREGERMLLAAEMKLPGEAVLEFRLAPSGPGVTELSQVARFLPRGLFGIVYWYALAPFHEVLFPGMLRAIARASGREAAGPPERFTPRAGGKSCPFPPPAP